MKKRDVKNLAEKNIEELKQMVTEITKELAKLNLDKNTQKLKNMRLLFHKKKDKAKILTVLHIKELAHG